MTTIEKKPIRKILTQTSGKSAKVFNSLKEADSYKKAEFNAVFGKILPFLTKK